MRYYLKRKMNPQFTFDELSWEITKKKNYTGKKQLLKNSVVDILSGNPRCIFS